MASYILAFALFFGVGYLLLTTADGILAVLFLYWSTRR